MFGLFKRRPIEVVLVRPPGCVQCDRNARAEEMGPSNWLWAQEAAHWGEKAGVYVNASASLGQPGTVTLAVQSYHGQKPYAPVGLEPHEAREVAQRLIDCATRIEARRRAFASCP